MNVVGRSLPLKRTTEVLTKPVPFVVSVKAGPPAVAEDGLRLVSVALLTARLRALEVPPPGAGVKTVIGKEPAA